MIVIAIVRAKKPIHSVDVFTPANELSNKAFSRFNRDFAGVKCFYSCVDDLSWVEQAVVDVGERSEWCNAQLSTVMASSRGPKSAK